MERISCVLYKSIGCQVKTPWPIGKDRIESGTSRRQKEFWDGGGTGRVARDDVRWTDAWYLSSGNQSCNRREISINGLV